MCQVTPFTLPCCRRIYVSVQRLANCPADWPKSKCPQELCIQIIKMDTGQVQHRPSGTCWRCKAAAAGTSGQGRENMRPEIDRAFIVEGLEELDTTGRRRKAEAGGNCWFCGAMHGCLMCGTKTTHDTPGIMPEGVQSKKHGLGQTGSHKKRKLKAENGGRIEAPSSLQPYSFPTGLSRPVLSQPSYHLTSGSQYPEIPSSTQSIPLFHHESPLSLPNIPEGTIGDWQVGNPYTGNANFGRGFDSVQTPSLKVRNSQVAVRFGSSLDNIHPPYPGIALDPGGASGANQENFSALAEIDDATLASMLNEYNYTPNPGGVEGIAQDAPRVHHAENTMAEGEASNIDPALAME